MKNHYYNYKNFRKKNSGRVKLYKINYNEFKKKFRFDKFSIIIDNCSVTHFDTRPFSEINQGWQQLIYDLKNELRTDQVFICATDIVVGSKVNSEFLHETDLIENFKKYFKLTNINQIFEDENYKKLKLHFSEFLNLDFKRVPPPGTVDGQSLGILGFVVRRNEFTV
jgi:hypothetical protein